MATTEKHVAATVPASEAVPRNLATAAMVVICAAVFLTALDQTVVVTALTPISASFNLRLPGDLPKLSWVVSGYLLGYVIIMPLMGRVSDILGRLRVMVGCLIVFAIGSFICADSLALNANSPLTLLQNIGLDDRSIAVSWLIIARFLQAVGGGAVVPVAIAAIGDLFGQQRRILALGIIGGVTEAGGALGPLYGALILEKWGWHPAGFDQPWQWIFLINLPLVLIILVLLILAWPKSLRPVAAAGARVDWLGAALLGGALLCTSLGLGQSAGALTSLKGAQTTQNNPLLIVLAVVLLAAFILVEAWQRDPVVSLALFRNRAFSAGAAFNLLLGMALIVALVDIPIYILDVIGTAAYLDAGLTLLRLTVMIPIGAFGGGWLVSRFGTRPVGIAGAVFAALGFGIMSRWVVAPNWTLITVGTVIAGLGFGLIVSPISTTALNTASEDRFGMAASIVTTLRMIGMILGLAALSSWGVSRYDYLVQHIVIPPNLGTDVGKIAAYEAQQQTAIAVTIVTGFFLAGMVISLLAIIPAMFLWKPASGEEKKERVVISA